MSPVLIVVLFYPKAKLQIDYQSDENTKTYAEYAERNTSCRTKTKEENINCHLCVHHLNHINSRLINLITKVASCLSVLPNG